MNRQWVKVYSTFRKKSTSLQTQSIKNNIMGGCALPLLVSGVYRISGKVLFGLFSPVDFLKANTILSVKFSVSKHIKVVGKRQGN